jgi:hypothetical protein
MQPDIVVDYMFRVGDSGRPLFAGESATVGLAPLMNFKQSDSVRKKGLSQIYPARVNSLPLLEGYFCALFSLLNMVNIVV